MPADRGVFEALGEIFSRHRGDRRVSFEIELPATGCGSRDVSAQIRVGRRRRRRDSSRSSARLGLAALDRAKIETRWSGHGIACSLPVMRDAS